MASWALLVKGSVKRSVCDTSNKSCEDIYTAYAGRQYDGPKDLRYSSFIGSKRLLDNHAIDMLSNLPPASQSGALPGPSAHPSQDLAICQHRIEVGCLVITNAIATTQI